MNFTSITVKSTRIRFLKLVVLGVTLLPDDLSNIGKKNMARGVNILKNNSKGKVGKNLFIFLDSGRNIYSFFKKKNSIFTCLNMPRQIKTFNATK